MLAHQGSFPSKAVSWNVDNRKLWELWQREVFQEVSREALGQEGGYCVIKIGLVDYLNTAGVL